MEVPLSIAYRCPVEVPHRKLSPGAPAVLFWKRARSSQLEKSSPLRVGFNAFLLVIQTCLFDSSAPSKTNPSCSLVFAPIRATNTASRALAKPSILGFFPVRRRGPRHSR